MGLRNKRTIFITGAGGFIGTNLTKKLLKKNFYIHVLNRTENISWRLKAVANQITVHNGDITDYNSLRRALLKTKPDYIIHLATYGAYSFQTEIDKIISVNILGTKNLLEASKDIPYKCFINTGSSSEYGFKDRPMKESDFCDPVSYYGVTKLAATQICKVFARINDKPIVTLRLFSVYGPYENHTRFIPTIIKSLIVKSVINLTPGNVRRDFIYINDVIDAYLKALRQGSKIKGETLNIGTGREFTNDEIVQILFKITGKKTKVKKGGFSKRGWDTNHWAANTAKSKKYLKWESKYSIEKGLSETYLWLNKNLKYYN